MRVKWPIVEALKAVTLFAIGTFQEWLRPSKQLWQVIDDEWRVSPPTSLQNFDSGTDCCWAAWF